MTRLNDDHRSSSTPAKQPSQPIFTEGQFAPFDLDGVLLAMAEASKDASKSAHGSEELSVDQSRRDDTEGTSSQERQGASDSALARSSRPKSAAALALTPVNAIKDVFLRHREKLSQKPKAYTNQQMDILRSICNMVIKICTLYRIDPLSKVLKRHQQFIGDAAKFLKVSQQEFAGKPEVCSSTEERYYNLVYTYQSVALLPIIAPRSK